MSVVTAPAPARSASEEPKPIPPSRVSIGTPALLGGLIALVVALAIAFAHDGPATTSKGPRPMLPATAASGASAPRDAAATAALSVERGPGTGAIQVPGIGH